MEAAGLREWVQKEEAMAPRRDRLELLMDELEFLDAGGYELRSSSFRMFKDSPSCPNFGNNERHVPCSECELAEFATPNERDELDCCQSIPLNRDGDTPEMLYNWGTPQEQKRYARMWLLQEIARASLQKAGQGVTPKKAR
jgi:hypothetical protein